MPVDHILALARPLVGRLTQVEMFRRSDITDTYIGWLNDPEVVRLSNQRFHRADRASCEAYFASFAGTDNVMLAVRKTSGEMIGTMRVLYARPHETADLGILIGDRSVWGRGYGFDAWNLVVEWLASHPRVRKITGGTAAPNTGMVRIMERSGMAYEATQFRQEVYDGQEVDLVFYARFVTHGGAHGS